MPPTNADIHDVLVKARAWLTQAPDRWCKGALFMGPPDAAQPAQACLLGSIAMTLGQAKKVTSPALHSFPLNSAWITSLEFDDYTSSSLADILEECEFLGYSDASTLATAAACVIYNAICEKYECVEDIPTFNDAEETTFDEVLNVLDCAIAAVAPAAANTAAAANTVTFGS